MALNGKYLTLDHVVEGVYRNFKFAEVNEDDAAEWLWDVVDAIGFPESLYDEYVKIDITDHKGNLPVNFHKINMVREWNSKAVMTPITDAFFQEPDDANVTGTVAPLITDPATEEVYHTYIPPEERRELLSFKLSEDHIWTGFTDGAVDLAYKAFPIHKDTGLPMIPDNSAFFKAAVSYIGERIAFTLFLSDELSERKYDKIEQKYLFDIGQARGECWMPDVNQMESLKNRWKAALPYQRNFDTGFKYMGKREANW